MNPSASLGRDEAANPVLDDLIAEITDRLQAGEAVDVEAYAAEHPDLAAELRRLLPALVMMAAVGSSPGSEPSSGAEHGELSLHGELGDFRIVREVGRGGMGIVYEAEQISLRRRVALKVLPFAATMDPRHLQRFHNEAQAAACLHHTNIVPVHFVGSERGVHFYAMQFIDGLPLSDVIRQLQEAEKKTPLAAGETRTAAYQPAPDDAPTPRPIADMTPLTGEGRRGRDYFRKVAELGVQAAEALDHAHQLGIVHRDIKPANLLLDARGNAWVTDFGLAHVQHGEGNLTVTGQALGTPRYMSPEQALAKRVPIDHRTDVYSLGATLYELLTLRPAFGSEDRQELLRQIAFEDPAHPRRFNKAIPAELEIIVLKAMEKRPQDRYATAQELADDLRRWLMNEPIRARRPSWVQVGQKWVRRHQAVVWSAAICSVLILAVVGASIGWIAGDRAVRRAEAAESFDEAVQQAIAFMQKEKWPEAKASAQRATGLLAGSGGEPVQQQRLQQLETDLKMAADLELARLQRAVVKDGHFDEVSAVPAYAEAFRRYNLPVLELDMDEVVRRIAASTISKQLLAALVDWSNIHPDPAEKKRLQRLIRLADRDPWRQQIWDTQDKQDGANLIQLAQSTDALAQPPARMVTLAQILAQFDNAAAVQFLRQAQQHYPDDFWINHWLAFYLDDKEPPQLEEAIGFYRVAVALRPQSPGVHLNLGVALGKNNRLDEAIVEFRKAISLKDDYADAHNDLGFALSGKGRLDEAMVEIRKAISFKNDDAVAHLNLGLVLRRKSQLDEAIAEYREAIRIKKDFAAAHVNLGLALTDKGQLDEAITEFREAIRLKPDFAEPHGNLGSLFEQQGQFRQALIYRHRMHELASRTHRELFHTAQSVRNCERLVELDSKLTAILSGQKQPADSAERLALAQMCQMPCKKLYVAAVRFYGESFSDKPQLADDLTTQHRYNAACAAALAAAGEGKEADRFDDKERARLRQQALDWLRADLKSYRRLMDKAADKSGPAIAQRMQHWLKDTDFAGVRGAESLAKLPEAERLLWQKLWQDVDALRQQATGTTKSADNGNQLQRKEGSPGKD